MTTSSTEELQTKLTAASMRIQDLEMINRTQLAGWDAEVRRLMAENATLRRGEPPPARDEPVNEHWAVSIIRSALRVAVHESAVSRADAEVANTWLSAEYRGFDSGLDAAVTVLREMSHGLEAEGDKFHRLGMMEFGTCAIKQATTCIEAANRVDKLRRSP